jgi:hypothetical protein
MRNAGSDESTIVTDSPSDDELQRLDTGRIAAQIETLAQRISERFPESGLRQVALQLVTVARRTQARVEWVQRPVVALRGLSALLVLVIAAGIVAAAMTIQLQSEDLHFTSLVQAIEAAINDVVFVGVAIFFVGTLEARIKRRRAMAYLHELRALSHIIDMHQLTKDPERIASRGSDTPSSPKQRLTPYLLSRYLDYCSELLSLTGKLAALYAQSFSDTAVIEAVNEIEDLTTGLSRKIWQKLMIVHAIQG